MNSKLFTPNVDDDVDGLRYRLYRHNENTFSVTPYGRAFHAVAVRAPCGLDCMCGARLTEIDALGKELLPQAETF